ncbi:PA14 domain-containing protein [Nocardia terpenica]|uniref:PA14 domain-containing protein n=1 Tax=Nocardia terpenica TaxID=455432 RepID=A0A291RJF1_9NOCA|nr:PA14 domain-containing protein [Nocardia terpenica]ATL67409.1 hypothetical protein CRH09_15585 [Nocardia terpenica]
MSFDQQFPIRRPRRWFRVVPVTVVHMAVTALGRMTVTEHSDTGLRSLRSSGRERGLGVRVAVSSCIRVIALAVAMVLAVSLAQVVVSPRVAAAPSADAREMPMLSKPDGSSAGVADGPDHDPKRSEADFGPLMGDSGSPARGAPKKLDDSGSAPPQPSLVSPVDDAVVSNLTPTLQVSAVASPSGNTALYCFKVSTGFDGRSGSVVDSGCLPEPSWTVPRDVLHDGARYTWTVETALSGGTTTTPVNWVGHFKVDQRIGDPGPAPADHFGPVTVNLVNGNVHTEDAGPTFQSVGGESGVGFAYNSQQGEAHGVRASYFNDSRHSGNPDDAPVLVRQESQVNLDWSGTVLGTDERWGKPIPPALDKQWFIIRWEGYFEPKSTGTYQFAGAHTDGAKIWVNDKPVYDNPNASGLNFESAQEVSLTGGQRVSLKVELYHHSSDPARMSLWAKLGTIIGTSAPVILPPEWLFPADLPVLPSGWTSGPVGRYTKAEMLDASVVLTDGAGGKHTWAKASDGGYTPPPDEDGVLGFDAGGHITVTDNGVVFTFNADGTLGAVSSVLDSKKPAALQYIYSGTPSRLTEIKDPVSGRSHTLYYNVDGSDRCYGDTPRPPGADKAPLQMLCRVRYWDDTETRLWYVKKSLGRIENPGSDVYDYGFDGDDRDGPLTLVRTGLVNDWAIRQTGNVALGAAIAEIAYTSIADKVGETPKLRAANVKLPSSDGGPFTPRPQHSYAYDLPNKQAFVNVAGKQSPTGYSRMVSYDDAGRGLTTTDADGNTVSTEWSAKDKVTATVDTIGRRTTVMYDHADRATDSNGPAPAACFNGQTPISECAQTMPHSHRGYDENLVGLETAFYDNAMLSGVPKEWTTGIGSADGSLTRTWGSTPPVANSGGWSGRFIGEIKLPATGEYKLGFTVVDGVPLWIDDVLTVDSWTDKPSTTVSGTYTNTTPDSWHRIRVDYYNRSGTTGALDFTWAPPGAGAAVTVPGQNLQPRYGLETSRANDSTSGGDVERAPSTKTVTGYSDSASGIDPVYGLAVSQTADPGGINLTSRRLFEQPGRGYLRQLAAALPAGEITSPDKRGTSVYYGDSETRANPCDSKSSAVSQGGRVKTITAAKNADGSANVLETVYDATGRIVAARTNNEPWSCLSYDTRGRTIKKSFPAIGDQPARTITYDYAVNGDPLTRKVSDDSGSATTVLDLLGRTVSYTDASGAVTTTGYDVAGRKTSETTTVKGAASTLNYQWDDAFRLTRLDLDGTTVATPGYNAGVLQSVAYGNGSTLAITYNDAGTPSGSTWKVSGSTVVDAVTRSRDQRITDEKITDTANPDTAYNYAYTYDGVGRLVAADVPHHQLTYTYGGDGGCGPNKKAGLNTDRTAFTDSFNGAPAATTSYCYDDADRLLSTSGATTLSLTYDAYGNAIKVGTDTLGYDSTRRHISTTTAAGRSVGYTRDLSDRIVVRSVKDNANPAQITRYGYTSDSGGPDFVLDGSGSLLQRILKLPGGAVLTKNYTQNNTANWSYPNIHGDILFTTDGTDVRTGTIHLYDPYGRNIDPVTGEFADIPIPATAEGGMDFGYLGQHTVPIEHVASQQALEMGARTYLPILGRFLQTDPVPGASANNYDYVNGDPINALDLTGECPECAVLGGAAGAAGLGTLGAGLIIGAAVVGTGYLAYRAYQELKKNNEPAPPPAKTPTPAQTEPTPATESQATGNNPNLPGVHDPSLGRGHTGRTEPKNLTEQLAMEKVMSNPAGKTIVPSEKMNDPRWPGKEGWVKQAENVDGIEIHYNRNVKTGEVDDFKFKDN